MNLAINNLVVSSQRCFQTMAVISFALLLSACSKINTKPKPPSTFSNLQRDFTHHKRSSYVNANLKPLLKRDNQKRIHPKAPNQATRTAYIANGLASDKRKLIQRKKQANARLNGVILHNGLFTPSKALQRQSHGSQAQNGLKSHARLASVLAIALRNNLDIKSVHDSAKASLARYDQVSFLNDSLAQYAALTRDLKLTGSNQKQKQSVASSFPSPGLATLKNSIIDKTVDLARLKLKQTTQDVITQTRIAYYELQFSRQEIVIANKNNKLLNALKKQVEDNYSTYDTANKLDLATILDVDIQINKNQNTLQIAKQKQQAKQARLNALLNLPSDFKLGRLDPLKAIAVPAKPKQLFNTAKRYRVEIELLRAEVKKLTQIIQLSQKRFYPDLDAGFSRFNSRGSKQKFNTKPKVKVNNFFAKNDSYLTETKLKQTALQSKIRALEIKTEDAIKQALVAYKTQQQSHSLYQTKIIPKAKATLDIALTLFETGETSYLDVIESEEKILGYQLLSLKAIKEMNISWAKLVRVVGK